MPIEIKGRCEDFAEFSSNELGVRVEAFWNPKSEEVQLRLFFRDHDETAAIAVWDGCSLKWESEPLKQYTK